MKEIHFLLFAFQLRDTKELLYGALVKPTSATSNAYLRQFVIKFFLSVKQRKKIFKAKKKTHRILFL